MGIKKEIETKISQIQTYLFTVSWCRDIKRKLKQAQRDIIATVDEGNIDKVKACIKSYYTSVPALDNAEFHDDLYPQVRYCCHFNDVPCPISNCPWYGKKQKCYEQQLLLQQAQKAKQTAFKGIFGRIK